MHGLGADRVFPTATNAIHRSLFEAPLLLIKYYWLNISFFIFQNIFIIVLSEKSIQTTRQPLLNEYLPDSKYSVAGINVCRHLLDAPTYCSGRNSIQKI